MLTDDEKWLPVREFPEDYEVSSLGRLKRVSACRGTRPGRMRKPVIARNGYAMFMFKTAEKPLLRMGHRIVADAFLGPIPQGMQVNHKNGVKHDNRVENLEIVTNSENRAHSYRILGIAPNRHGILGIKNPNAKLDWDKVDAIRAAYASGSASYTQLGRAYGVTKQVIYSVVKGKTWRELDRPPRP